MTDGRTAEPRQLLLQEDLTTVRELSRQYAKEVRARKDLGDSLAEYHSKRPKIEAYKLLIDSGLTPKQAVAEFQRILQEVDKT
jgi:hypothetical protein